MVVGFGSGPINTVHWVLFDKLIAAYVLDKGREIACVCVCARLDVHFERKSSQMGGGGREDICRIQIDEGEDVWCCLPMQLSGVCLPTMQANR